MTQQTMNFQAEVKQLLHLMIHSLYSNKEIFLRELISNSSDAGDRLRFEALTDNTVYENDPNIRIRISVDKVKRVITIDDNGIGMSRDEVITNLGTIARSGTKEFLSKLSGDQKKDVGLIGQFGVGFYSGFIVADRITVETRRAGLPKYKGILWESTGENGDFIINEIERIQRGTLITLHLREGEDDILSTHKLKSIIQKYSDHISFPILMKKEEWNQEKGEMIERNEDETVNQASALWSRSKSDITDEQYKQFYKHLTHDHNDPLTWTHNHVEGRIEYTQLLYVPSHAPSDMWDFDHRGGLKLYVKRVFVMDDADQLLPKYLRFIRGIIDLSDMPLNISREILQQSYDAKMIREGITKRVLSMLEDLAQSCDESKKEKFSTLWNAFGQIIKEGVGDDDSNRDRIINLLRFSTTHSDIDIQDVSLSDYVKRMKSGQTKIYYITSDGWKTATNSPHLEVFRKKCIEVLLLTDRVDEWMLSFLREFDGRPLVSIARGCLDLSELSSEEKSVQQTTDYTIQSIINRMKEVLGDKVKDVRVTSRLTDSPSCLVADDREMSGYLQRILKASGQKSSTSFRPILEINPEHTLIRQLTTDNDNFDDWCHILFDQALLSEGGILDDPSRFVKRANSLLLAKLTNTMH